MKKKREIKKKKVIVNTLKGMRKKDKRKQKNIKNRKRAFVRKVRKEKRTYPYSKKVTYNNKSRKGEYMYVKGAQGEAPRIYKIRKGLKKRDYLLSAKEKIGKKKKKGAESYVEKIRKRKSIEGVLRKGIGTSILDYKKNVGQIKVQQAYKRTLKGIVRDKLLLDILSREENVVKFKNRLGYEIIVTDKDTSEIVRLAHAGEKTLRDVIKDIDTHIKIGSEVSQSYQEIGGMKSRKWNLAWSKNSGVIGHIKIKIVFRKG